MTPRRAAKTDGNHQEIRDGLRACGFIVIDTARAGDGFPDLAVVNPHNNRVYLLEIKDQGGRLTAAEVQFMVGLVNPAYRIVYGLDEAIQAMQEG